MPNEQRDTENNNTVEYQAGTFASLFKLNFWLIMRDMPLGKKCIPTRKRVMISRTRKSL